MPHAIKTEINDAYRRYRGGADPILLLNAHQLAFDHWDRTVRP